MSWTTALENLRALLSDGPKDKLQYRKKCLGTQDGVNKRFKTFEERRLNDFTTSDPIIGVFVNSAQVTVTADMPEIGEFTLTTAPTNDALIEATYYQQWFRDTELNFFLSTAATWLGLSAIDQVTEGLRASALKYAAADAYQKLSLQWARNMGDVYKMQDQDPENRPIDPYKSLANQLRKDATESRDQFYLRQGRSLQPLHASLTGRVGSVTPRR